MSFKVLKFATIITAILVTVVPDPADALVAQSASSAMRSDNFVGDSNSNKTELKKLQKERERQRKEEQKRQEKALRDQKKRMELQQKLNALRQKEQARGTENGIPASNSDNEQQEIEKQLQQLNSSLGNASKKASSPEVPYTKSYASKLFQTYSGHITIEQKNIPKKIAVTKGSTIQLNLENKPGTIWYIVNDDKVAKIKSNKENGSVRNVVLEATGKGSTKLIFDNILTENNNYKVLTTKRMRLIVDNAK